MNRRLLAAAAVLVLIPSLSLSAFALSYTDDCEKMQSDDTVRYQGFLKENPLLDLGWAGCDDLAALKMKGSSATVIYRAGGAESMKVEILTDMPTYAVNDVKDGYVFGKYPFGNVEEAIRCRYDKNFDSIFTFNATNDYVLQSGEGMLKFERTDRQCDAKSEFFGLNVATSAGNSQFKECGDVVLTSIYAPENKSFYRETYMVKIPPGTVEIKLKLVFFNLLQGVNSPNIYGVDKNMLLSRVIISGDRLYMGDNEPPPEPEPPEPEPSEPDTSEPEPSRPESSKPESSRPESSRPESSRPESSRPESSRPESSRPESSKPESSRPESSKPEPSRPESSKPESSRPESSKPESSRPESSNPGSSEPESSGTGPVSPPVQPQPPIQMTDYASDVPVDDMGAGLLKPYGVVKDGVRQETPQSTRQPETDSTPSPDTYPVGADRESSQEAASSPPAEMVGAQKTSEPGEPTDYRDLLVTGGSINAVAVSYIGISLLLRRRG